jgi:hypothetical protein
MAIEMDFFKSCLIDESSKLPHQPPIEKVIIFVFSSIHHVKVTTE